MAQENTDSIFLLTYLSLQVRDLRVCDIEYLLRLKHIQLGGDAMVEPQPRQLDRLFLYSDRVLSYAKLKI
jgi:hypothetical protein